MLTRALNTFALLALFALPLYGARERVLRRRPPAQTPAEHRADLSALSGVAGSEYLIEGHGAPRSDYGQCQHGLPAFEKMLVDNGLKPIEAVTCVPLEDSPEAYAPSFRVIATLDLSVKTVQGARYNTESFCDAAAEKMKAELARTMTVLETSCGPVQTAAAFQSDALYQPISMVLAPNDDHAPRIYSSIEVLTESTSAATRRDLAGANAEPELSEQPPASDVSSDAPTLSAPAAAE